DVVFTKLLTSASHFFIFDRRIHLEEKRNQSKLSLRTRLLVPFLLLMVLSVVSVGLSSYIQAKEMTLNTMKDRMIRVVQPMGYIAENLHFVNVSDEEYFMQELNSNIRTQKQALENDGMDAE